MGSVVMFSEKEVSLDWGSPELCPSCHRKSWNIPQNITLISHIREAYWTRMKELTDTYKGFRFCPHQGCEVVYYHPDIPFVATIHDLRTRVGYKVTDPPVPVCYCIGVLARTIREEIVVKQCCDTLEDIKKYTGANTGKWCHITNPSGRCCGPMVRRVVESALRERVSVSLKDEAVSLAQSIPDNSETPEEPTVEDSCCSL